MIQNPYTVHEYFAKADPILFGAMQKVGELQPISKRRSKTDHFTELCASIVSQQLSTKVADVIWERIKKLHALQKTILRPSRRGGTAQDDNLFPEIIVEIPTEEFRSQGMSYSKIKYIKDLAQKVIEREVILEELDALPDEEVIEKLIIVKGIGRWTVEMFLIFSLDRPDVFSLGDLGLKRAIQRLYGLKSEPTEKKLLSLSKKWAPYRSYASRILWRSLDNETKK